MGENQDISKIIGIIMENPDIIARIRSLADESDIRSAPSAAESSVTNERDTVSVSGSTHECKSQTSAEANRRRRELLTALKPYVKCERARAIDTMLTVIDVIGVMKER